MTGSSRSTTSRFIDYLRACTAAEHAAVECLALDGTESALLLERGAAPLGDTPAELAPSNRAGRWSQARSAARDAGEAETLWVGWPLVQGHRRVAGRRAEVVAALLIGRARLVRTATGAGGAGGSDPDGDGAAPSATLLPVGTGVELGDAALDLLGIPGDERALLRADFDRALNRGRGDPIGAAVRFLDARGVTAAATALDRLALGPLDRSHVLSNTAVAWVGPAPAARSPIIDDLDGLAGGTVAADSALGALIGQSDRTAPGPARIEPVPGTAPLDIHQETAIAAATHHPLTAVTAPAGLARTHLIVNTVSAAVARGQRVLVVAPTDRALDVIRDGITSSSPAANVVHAGAAGLRGPGLDVFDRALRAPATRDDGDGDERPDWSDVVATCAEPYAALTRRRELTARLETVTRRRTEAEQTLPGDLTAGGDLTALAPALAVARERSAELDALPRGRPWHRPRLRSAQRALDAELARVVDALGGPVHHLARARLAVHDRTGTLELAGTVLAVLEMTEQISTLVDGLSALPDETAIAADIERGYPLRRPAADHFAGERWRAPRDAGPRQRSNTSLYSAGLATASDEAPSQAELHALVPGVLDVLPVWLVPAPAVGWWLPLTPALFDLVIVDGAGRLDVASASGALARGRRAMVVGDSSQLPPVLHVTTDLDAQLAGEHGLSEDDHRRFSHRRGSLLVQAARLPGAAAVTLPVAHGTRPRLVDVLSRTWYAGKVRSATSAPGGDDCLTWVDHVGVFEPGRDGRSGRNASEALAVLDEVLAQLGALTDRSPGGPVTARSIGVIAMLDAQRDAVADLLLERVGRTIGVDTPETFQGDERDVIVVSLGVGEGARRELVDVAADPARLNVALSAARSRVVIVGDRAFAGRSGTLLASLADEVTGAGAPAHGP